MRRREPTVNGIDAVQPEFVRIRRPGPEDGSMIWELVQRSESLESNSCYAYLLLTSHFAGTSLVAELGGNVVGFVVAYRPPTHPDSIFVWQIGVDEAQRGRGIAKALLHALIRCPGCAEIEYLEATVGASNMASKGLFEKFARDIDADCAVTLGFSSSLFPSSNHESESLFRIGPIHLNKADGLGRPHETV
ncbi:MAG: diaminobutyrate acetyltransferase [Polyangiales bacterium]